MKTRSFPSCSSRTDRTAANGAGNLFSNPGRMRESREIPDPPESRLYGRRCSVQSTVQNCPPPNDKDQTSKEPQEALAAPHPRLLGQVHALRKKQLQRTATSNESESLPSSADGRRPSTIQRLRSFLHLGQRSTPTTPLFATDGQQIQSAVGHELASLSEDGHEVAMPGYQDSREETRSASSSPRRRHSKHSGASSLSSSSNGRKESMDK